MDLFLTFAVLALVVLVLIWSALHSSKSDREKREQELLHNMSKHSQSRAIPAPNKQMFGRCANAVGRFGFDVSNPIRIKALKDACLEEYLYDMYIGGEGISGYIVVSTCWCSLYGNKPIYRVGVRKKDKKGFITLFFIEDGITIPKYYPIGIKSSNDMYFQNIIKNGGHVSFRNEIFQNAELLNKEGTQKALPILKEKVYAFSSPKKEEGEDKKQYASKVQNQSVRELLSAAYWKQETGCARQ